MIFLGLQLHKVFFFLFVDAMANIELLQLKHTMFNKSLKKINENTQGKQFYPPG